MIDEENEIYHGVFNGSCSLFPRVEKVKLIRRLLTLNLPSLAKPKSVSLSTASSALLVKSKFSGLRSPIRLFIQFFLFFQFTKFTHDVPRKTKIEF